MDEIWKDIKDYEGFYQVSNYGRVKSLEREIEYLVKGKYKGKRAFPSIILNPYKNNGGYLMIDLTNRGKRIKYLIHRLVAEAFIPNPDNKPCVDHINTDKTDNRVENLQWCTYTENNLNPLTLGRMKEIKRNVGHLHTKEANKKRKQALTGHKLSDETKEKISNSKGKKVYQYTLNGELVNVFKSSVEASKITGFPQAQINKYSHGKYFSKIRNKWYYSNEYKGYKWSFVPL